MGSRAYLQPPVGPERKWGLASLPAPTVPDPFPAGEGEAIFTGRIVLPIGFRPRPCGLGRFPIRSLSKRPCGFHRVSRSGFPIVGLAASEEGRLRITFEANSEPRSTGSLLRLATLRGSLAGSFRSELLPVPFRGSFAEAPVPLDPSRKVGSASACAFASRFFLSVALPSLAGLGSCEPPPLPRGSVFELRTVSSRPLSATRRVVSRHPDSRLTESCCG